MSSVAKTVLPLAVGVVAGIAFTPMIGGVAANATSTALGGSGGSKSNSLITTAVGAFNGSSGGLIAGAGDPQTDDTGFVPPPSANNPNPTIAPAVDSVGKQVLSGTPADSPGIFDKGGFIERNQTLIGSTIGGIGKGLLSDSRQDALLERDRERRDAISNNFGGRGLLSKGDVPESGGGLTPGERFTPASGAGQWVFDPSQGRLVFVPNQAA